MAAAARGARQPAQTAPHEAPASCFLFTLPSHVTRGRPALKAQGARPPPGGQRAGGARGPPARG